MYISYFKNILFPTLWLFLSTLNTHTYAFMNSGGVGRIDGIQHQNDRGCSMINSSKSICTKLLMASITTDQVTSPIDDILYDLHSSGFPFRVVVVGNGAILESTQVLAPVMKSSISPKSGEKLTTFASSDSSFEFHIKPDSVKQVKFVEIPKPVLVDGAEQEKILRICRFLNNEGGSICSLILADSSVDAGNWFSDMKKKYENE